MSEASAKNPIKTIAVIGSGQMGAGIAQVAAQSGFQVLLFDAKDGAVARAIEGMKKSLTKLKEKAVITEDPEIILKRLQPATSLIDIAKADLVIEAIVENLAAKQELFKQLDAVCPASVIFASNTSSISITSIAATTKRPDKFVGMHFMNPVPLMKLVELISGLATDPAIFSVVKACAEKMGKTCVASKDKAGFIINRVLMPYINEACFVLEEGLGSAEDIDIGMKLGTNVPMGPLALADFIGLDTCLYIMEVLHKELGDSKYRPAPLLRQYVTAGWLGKKSKRGFYRYE